MIDTSYVIAGEEKKGEWGYAKMSEHRLDPGFRLFFAASAHKALTGDKDQVRCGSRRQEKTRVGVELSLRQPSVPPLPDFFDLAVNCVYNTNLVLRCTLLHSSEPRA